MSSMGARELTVVPGGKQRTAASSNRKRSRRRDLIGAEIGDQWQCELVPINRNVADDPSIRLVVAMVVSGEFVLAAESLDHPPSEIAALARIMAEQVRAAMDAADGTPATVHVRHKVMAQALAPILAGEGIKVKRTARLRYLDKAADSLIAFDPDGKGPARSARKGAAPPRISRPDSWKAWQLPRDQISMFFSACAELFRAAPWKVMSNSHLLEARVRNGGEWSISVMGDAGVEFGIVLYEERQDFEAVMQSDDPMKTFRDFKGSVISLSFERERDLYAAMTNEVRFSRWEVASPNAWPNVICYNTVAGGLTQRTMDDLIAILPAVAKFSTMHADWLLGDSDESIAGEWIGDDAEVQLRFVGVYGADASSFPAPPELLARCFASGSAASPLAVFDPHASWDDKLATARQIIPEFEEYLAANSDRLKEGRARSSARGARGRRGSRQHAIMAEHFAVNFLAGAHGTPIAAVTEFDLRLYLYDWFPRKTITGEREFVDALTSLRLFFQFLASEKGIESEWAFPILSDSETFIGRLRSLRSAETEDEAIERHAELLRDLDARVFLHDMGSAGGVKWSQYMGSVEASFHHILQRFWLKWRDEIVARGIRDPERVRELLVARQLEFENTAVPGEAQSPKTLIAREQKSLRRTFNSAHRAPKKRQPRKS